jgi:hypothetical protein
MQNSMDQPYNNGLGASHIISVFLSDEGNGTSPRVMNDSKANISACSGSGASNTSKNKIPRDLHFGDLIEKSFGMNSFDLKREMEILRKVDEEVTTVKFK